MSTEQPRPLQGYRESQETKKDAPVDPKKFQEELSKVRESDESQQRSQRNLKRSEEEGDEEELAKKEIIQASGALFAMFMKKSLNQSLLTPQTPQNVRGSQAPAASSQFTIEDDSSTSKAPAPTPAAQEPMISLGQGPAYEPPQGAPIVSSFEQPQVSKDQPITKQPTTEPEVEIPTAQIAPSYPEVEKPEAAPSDQPAPSVQRVTKKEAEDTSLYGQKKKTKGQIEKEKLEKSPEVRLEKKESAKLDLPKKNLEDTPDQKPTLIAKEGPKAPLGTKALDPAKQEILPKPFLKEGEVITKVEAAKEEKGVPSVQGALVAALPKEKEVKEKEAKKVESLEKGVSIKTETGGFEEKSDKKKEEEKEEIAATSLAQIPVAPISIPAIQEAAPAYATLPPQVYELFEKMVGMMTIEMLKGVTTTTVTISMKNSVFDGAQIILDHYSTAPNAFNVTLAVPAQAQQLLDANLEKMVASFQASKLSFEVNLRRPILLESQQAFRRKEKVGEEASEENPEGK